MKQTLYLQSSRQHQVLRKYNNYLTIKENLITYIHIKLRRKMGMLSREFLPTRIY